MINPAHDPNFRRIVEALRGLAYGSLVITIHNSRIVQIERTEKHRIHTRNDHEKSDDKRTPSK
jgi:hypothetical protein